MSKNGWGGKRTGSGPKPNPLKSAKLALELLERGRKHFGENVGVSPLEHVLAIMWSADYSFETRLEAAKVALPFCHPKLSSIDLTSEEDRRLVIEFVDFNKQVVSNADTVSPIQHNPAVKLIVDQAIEEELAEGD